jgi:hypothetical protein
VLWRLGAKRPLAAAKLPEPAAKRA